MNIMKKSKNLVLTAAALLMVSVGSTYAWFTASDADTIDISLGDIGVETTLETLSDEDGIDLEPGLTVESTGAISNTGSLYSLVKIEEDSVVTYKGTSEAVAAPEDTISFEVSPENGAYEDWENGVIWYTDENGAMYLLMDPQSTVDLSVDACLNGENLDNSLMGSKVSFKVNSHAVQAIEEAVVSEFGIELDSLRPVEESLTRSSSNQAMEHLFEIMGRK